MPYLGLRGTGLTRAIISLVVGPAFICYGYNLSVAGGLLTLLSFTRQFPLIDTIHVPDSKKQFHSQIQGTVVALFTVGGIFGSLSCIWLGDLLGRRKMIFMMSGVSIIGAILMSSSFSLAQFIVARLVLGVGTGGYLATVPVWQSEISLAHKRGAHVVTDGIFVGIGTALALFIDLGMYFVPTNSVSWRFPLAFQICLSLTVMVFISIFPESPRWLLKKGRTEEARRILSALRDAEPDSEVILNEMRDIEYAVTVCGQMGWMDMLKMGEQRLFHRTILAATGQMFQQLCGVNAITFYATTIFQQYLNLNATNARVLSACMTLMQVFGGCLAFVTIDRLGRRPLMLYSAAVMCICMALLAGCTSPGVPLGGTVVACIALFIFQFTFTVGYAGLTYLYAAEIAPLPLRAAISAVSTAAVWVFNFLLAEVTPVGFTTISNRYYIVFVCTNAAIVPTIYFFFPETKGRTLEEIDEIFLQSKSILDPPRVARSLPAMHLADVHPEGTQSKNDSDQIEHVDMKVQENGNGNGIDVKN